MTAAILSSSYDLLPAGLQEQIAKQVVQGRIYRLSDKQTPGLGFDDRLTVRLGLSKNTIKKYIGEGRLRAADLDGKILVTEQAILDFANGVPSIDALPGLTGRINTAQLTRVETLHLPVHAVRLAAETELARRAHEIVTEEPELADEARYVVRRELQRRSAQSNTR